MKSSALAKRAASRTASSGTSARRVMFSRIEWWMSFGFWNTALIDRRSSSGSRSRVLTPSIRAGRRQI